MSTDLSKIEKVPGFCPLCDSLMTDRDKEGKYFICRSNPKHRIHIEKEWAPYIAGIKDLKWLKWRLRVRMGKMLQAERKHDKKALE